VPAIHARQCGGLSGERRDGVADELVEQVRAARVHVEVQAVSHPVPPGAGKGQQGHELGDPCGLLAEAARADVGVTGAVVLHHLHLTSNSLGVSRGTEAYLALLLIQQESQRPERRPSPGVPRGEPVSAA
jgi:hypothetical protein